VTARRTGPEAPAYTVRDSEPFTVRP
jgi:hypothetical protein